LSALIDHISIIQNKLQQLLKQYEHLQKENDKQQDLINTLQEDLEKHKDKMNEMQQQNLILKASVTDMDATDKKELEQKIQQYIKNIDKCISLLSK
jgi:DNA repair exonuclease SbcCD ATPase subunit